ncbi:hypothetical protein LCGC14_0364490 [marine sediment metagenome]|uniref:Uncharacterized protein n=1 Tax=marine sediment metagenome TaxID=412755 RepID=A0A0F9TPS0_9ZZZZ
MKQKKLCKCGCGRAVVINRQTGISYSKYAPNCLYKRNYAKSNIKNAHKKTLKLPKSRTPMQRAVGRADFWFSKYIRLIKATVYGDIVYVECYTCRTLNNIKKMDCGHFIGRGHHSVRWEVNNARPQCTKCNCYQGGKHFEFEQRLLKEIGTVAVDELKEKGKNISDFSEKEIREIVKIYRVSVRFIEKEKGIKVW